MDATPFALLSILFLLLMLLIGAAVTSEQRGRRLRYGIAARIFAAIAFFFTGTVVSFNYNAWYSSAADKLLTASVKAMEEGRQAAVLREWKAMDGKFRWSYETRGNFRKIAEEAIQGMSAGEAR